MYKGNNMREIMASMNFDTKNQSFNELLSPSYNYIVPPFQRDYSWQEEDWNELWQDVLTLKNEEPDSFHYMGYLVLQSEDTKNFKIVDGQQRITTISISILAACSIFDDLIAKNIDAVQSETRKQQFLSQYIGYTDPVLICYHTKLQLNKHNNNYYQTYLATLSKLPLRRLNNSEQKLRKSFIFFKKEMESYLSQFEDKGTELAKLILFITEKLCFTTITVSNEINAFKVFETLNARGVKLSSTDLLKNYIFSLITNEHTHHNELQHLESRWERIVTTVGAEDLTEIVRIYWNSKSKLTRKKELFKTIKLAIKSKEEAFTFLKDLDECADIYTALNDVFDSNFWDHEESKHLDRLFNIFNVKQPMPMLIASYKAFYNSDRRSFKKILKYTSTITFRYNIICAMPPPEQERAYSAIAQGISSGTYDADAVLTQLRNRLYPSDDVFKNDFINKVIKTGNNRNAKIAKYILIEIEKSISQSKSSPDPESVTIEHILPRNPSDNWELDPHSAAEHLCDKIGNMCLLTDVENKSIGNDTFPEKIETFKKSAMYITKYIGDNYTEWTKNSIDSRQKYYAKQAISIWSLND
ncbi:DUF262 domain-containing HNH endonuclease family protein [Proteus terrae]|uniref:DUF262 domain-containing protein n=1 Tax=Proteus TaxID=583 RepID=UPI0002833564|nr:MULTISPECIES: DUF262 domain-containing protein [Proteus]EKA97182.1 hypothetical protein HMPREF1310_02327 [Proteus mirabilis WGLW4]MCE9839639.1 DUF262 domain-containing HNH endonuclease family protein [Proteus terrae]MDM3559522.1 DUF262 domain-containing HNH endonuclease family protein [Proteus vulgaris]MDR9740742.1 DUF262 domain-containing HNH endonuclease family protein [Proteus terrae]